VLPARESAWIVEKARSLGVSLCGLARIEEFPELERLPEWLARGYAGEMRYLEDPRRTSPAQVLPGARSLIVCALNYNSAQPLSTECAAGSLIPTDFHRRGGGSDFNGVREAQTPRGWISRYAWGDDYHRVLGDRLEQLIAAMRREFRGPFEALAYVDTGPIVERVAAKHAGLGWLGKNTCLIHPSEGSWLFLGVIITTLDLAPSLGPGEPPQPDLCGQCTLCLEACPTGALVEPYVLDARRCISYLTIEHRGSLPEELRAAMGTHVFGCDICQDVCPWNRKAPATPLAEFSPRSGRDKSANDAAREAHASSAGAPSPSDSAASWSLFAPELEWLASLSEEEYRRVFRGSAVKRAKYRGLVRNACVALGNTPLPRAVRERVRTQLERLAAGSDAVIAEHAAWALLRIAAVR
jgi:epoxyqueuosine reductase